ncbi:MAG: hypothetical protein GX117_04200 [Candidatus Hydrogenedentes bacterium]|nr:hypothetical protein [Candidatus Hydrogenedentota bacterium]
MIRLKSAFVFLSLVLVLSMPVVAESLAAKSLAQLEKSKAVSAEVCDFVVCADPQPGGFLGTPKIFLDMMDEWNLLNPDLIVCAGDMIMGGPAAEIGPMWDEFLGNVEKLNAPFFATPGNHDINEEVEVMRVYEERVAPLYYAFTRGNTLFVILNTEEPGHPDGFSEEQRDWLRDTLANNPAEHIFIFLHVPFFALNWERDWQPTADIIQGYPVRAVISGHEHYYRDYGEKDGVRYIICGSAGGGFREPEEEGGFFCYLWVKVRGEEYTISLIKPGAVFSADLVTDAGVKRLHSIQAMIEREPIAHPWNQAFDQPVTMTVHNPFDTPLKMELRWTCPPQWQVEDLVWKVSVAAGSQESQTTVMKHAGPDFFPVPSLEGVVEDPVTGKTIALNRDVDLAPTVDVPRAAQPVILDGDLSEWSHAPCLPMRYGVSYDPADTDDLEACARVMWDDDYLYIAVESEDNEFHQPYYGDVVWMADSVELWIENSNWSFSLTPRDPQVFSHDLPDKHLDVITTAVSLGVVQEGRRIIYEAAYPIKELYQVDFVPGSSFGFSILVNDLDPSGPVIKRHYAELTPGAGAHFACPKYNMILKD